MSAPSLHPLSCRYDAQHIPHFLLTFIIWFWRKEREPFSHFPVFPQHSVFFCFHSPVLISFQPVIILLDQSCQCPLFFWSPAPSFISLVCLNLPPADCQPTYLHFPCQGWLVRAEGRRSEEKRLAKIKGPRPLPWAELLPNAIYLSFASPCVSLMERRSQETQTHTTHRLDTMTSQTVPPKKGTFRQTYGFILPGWALALQPISPHYLWHDNSYNMPRSSHPPCLADGATFKRQMSKSFITAHHEQLGFGTELQRICGKKEIMQSNVGYSVNYWRQSDTTRRNQGGCLQIWEKPGHAVKACTRPGSFLQNLIRLAAQKNKRPGKFTSKH